MRILHKLRSSRLISSTGVYEEELTVPKTSRHYDEQSEFSTKDQKLTVLINHFVGLSCSIRPIAA